MADRKDRLKRGIPLLLIMVLAGFWIYAGIALRSTDSGTAADRISDGIKRQIAISDNAIRKFVEHAHRTVTVTSVKITKCEVRTSDGSAELKDDLSNFERVDIEFSVNWNGWFHRGGNTSVGYSLLPGNGTTYPTPLKVLSTTALYTRDDCR